VPGLFFDHEAMNDIEELSDTEKVSLISDVEIMGDSKEKAFPRHNSVEKSVS